MSFYLEKMDINYVFKSGKLKDKSIEATFRNKKYSYKLHDHNTGERKKLKLEKEYPESCSTIELDIFNPCTLSKTNFTIQCQRHGPPMVGVSQPYKYCDFEDSTILLHTFSIFKNDGKNYILMYHEPILYKMVFLPFKIYKAFQKDVVSFLRDEETITFSEEDKSLVLKVFYDYCHNFLKEKKSFDLEKQKKERVVKVLFVDGIKNINISHLEKHESDYLNDMIENLQEDEVLDVFSELTFCEFQKTFYWGWRSSNSKTWNLLHKIGSKYFTDASKSLAESLFSETFYRTLFYSI